MKKISPERARTRFEEYLAKKSLKLTRPRRVILERAMALSGHFTAEKLLEVAKAADRTISKATVYRTLPLLTASGILEEQDFGSGMKSYEAAIGQNHHDHLICIRCRTILEFENQAIERLQVAEAKKKHFHIVYHSLKLFGFCASCQSK